MPTLGELSTDPQFGALSPNAKQIVVDRLSQGDERFGALSLGAQQIVKNTLLGTSAASLPSPSVPPQEPSTLAIPQPPGLLSRTASAVTPLIPQTTGAIAGGVVGGVAGLAVGSRFGVPSQGAMAGRVIGSGLGAGVGEVAQIGLEKIGLVPPPAKSAEIVPRIKSAVKGGAIGEVGGAVMVKGFQKVLAPFASKVTTAGREALNLFGKTVTPAQVTSSRVLDVAENISGSSLLGGGRMQAFRLQQGEIAKNLADQMVDAMGPRMSGEAAGDVVAEGITRRGDAFRVAAKEVYGALDAVLGAKYANVPTITMRPSTILDASGQPMMKSVTTMTRELVGGGTVTTTGLKQFARDYLEKQGETLATLRGTRTESLLKDTLGLPDTISFSHAQHLRSELLQVKRVISDPESSRFVGATQQLSKHIDAAMENGAKALSGEAARAWRAANSFYKKGQETFYRRYVTKLVEKNPEKIADYLLSPKATTTVRAVKAATTPEGFKAIQSQYSQKLLSAATDANENLIGTKLTTTLKRYGATTREVLGPEMAQRWEGLGRVLTTIQAKQGEGTGKIFIQLKQAGAITEAAGLLLGGAGVVNPVAAGTIVLGPAALGRIMTNPRAIRWLTTGLTAPVGSQRAIHAASQILAASRTSRSGTAQETIREQTAIPAQSETPVPGTISLKFTNPVVQSRFVKAATPAPKDYLSVFGIAPSNEGDRDVLNRIIHLESAGNPRAVNLNTRRGKDSGAFQFNPENAKRLGVNETSPMETQVRAAEKRLAELKTEIGLGQKMNESDRTRILATAWLAPEQTRIALRGDMPMSHLKGAAKETTKK